jgi:hypothetical protein
MRTRIEIVSGEGTQGTAKEHTGKATARAVRARLTRERCGGDRWAFARVDGRRCTDEDLNYILRAGGK